MYGLEPIGFGPAEDINTIRVTGVIHAPDIAGMRDTGTMSAEDIAGKKVAGTNNQDFKPFN
jgi:hypothetical protein